MRTTITLDPDVERLVKQEMSATGHGFKAVLNDALRAALGADEDDYVMPVFHTGPAHFDVDHAWRTIAELDDAHLRESGSTVDQHVAG